MMTLWDDHSSTQNSVSYNVWGEDSYRILDYANVQFGRWATMFNRNVGPYYQNSEDGSGVSARRYTLVTTKPDCLSSYNSSSLSSFGTTTLCGVFAFSAKSLQVLLFLAAFFQFLTFSFFRSSVTSSCHRCLGLPTGLVLICFQSNTFLVGLAIIIQSSYNWRLQYWNWMLSLYKLKLKQCNCGYQLRSSQQAQGCVAF
jgi:hypothetical protein